jgi:hypothetical protein
VVVVIRAEARALRGQQHHSSYAAFLGDLEHALRILPGDQWEQSVGAVENGLERGGFGDVRRPVPGALGHLRRVP